MLEPSASHLPESVQKTPTDKDPLFGQRTLGVKDLLQVRTRDREDKVEVGSPERRVLDHVVRTGDREREEMEDAVDDREEKGVEDLEEVGLWQHGTERTVSPTTEVRSR